MFEIKKCTSADFDEIKAIQDEAFAILPDKDLLRKNTDEMLLSCLNSPHITLGAYKDGEMAAFSVLYFPEDTAENLANSLKNRQELYSANYKLCIVREKYRGNGLQRRLASELEKYARERGVELLCVTVSPKNRHSINNIEALGYTYDSTLEKYGLERHLYYKVLEENL